MTTKISTDNIQAATLTSLQAMKVSNVSIANSTYHIKDDTAVNTSGGYLVITGSGFVDGASVIINETPALAVSFIDSTRLNVQVDAKSAATYDVYVVNPDGSTAIRVNGLTYSGTPTWVTTSPLDNQAVDVAFNVAFDATGATSYAVATGSSIPDGTTLLSNGYFYGTITGIIEETTYNFTIDAIDAENQEASKAFSVTVTVGPPVTYAYGWGYNQGGRIGINETYNTDWSSPVQIGSKEWLDIIPGGSANFFIKEDGTLWGTGSGIYIGVSDTISRSSPVQVGSLTDWEESNIRNSGGSVHVIKSNGTLWGWGAIGYADGAIGDGQRLRRSSPVQIGSDTNWYKISGSEFHKLAIKTDGTLWSWGHNLSGCLGLGDLIYRSSPVQIGSDTDWTHIESGDQTTDYYNSFALKSDSSLWGWGTNVNGILGLGTSTVTTQKKSVPTAIAADKTWSKIQCQTTAFMGIDTDGKLWGWGKNTYGVLGLNDGNSRSSPVQIGTDTDWYDFARPGDSSAASTQNFLIYKTNGSLWGTGRGDQFLMQGLGIGDAENRSSPVQLVAAPDWVKITSDGTTHFILKQ